MGLQPAVPVELESTSDILDATQLASLLHLHPVTVRLKAASGEIPGWQIGNRWRFYRSRIIERLSEGKDNSNAA
jgi:excisionase family DNA binding protein